MNERINRILLRLSRRAESADRDKLVESFVDAGLLLALLESRDHQIIYGRRGTGKTHAVLYLAEHLAGRGDIPVYLDMRTVGSTGGIYSDDSLPLSERATRLLQDTLSAVHAGLLQAVLSDISELNLGVVGPILDRLADAAAEVIVSGPVQTETDEISERSISSTSAVSADLGPGTTKIGLGNSRSLERHEEDRARTVISGQKRHRLHFGTVGRSFRELTEAIRPHRIWIFLDEWSVVPLELQPYLADFIRRSVLPVGEISVKICAIDHRTNLQIQGDSGSYIGIEVGADVTADVSLDDFMVFENDADAAIAFFKELVFKHYRAARSDEDGSDLPDTSDEFVANAFSQRNAFEELVKAAEGVPRDAINVVALCAQKAGKEPISVPHIRGAGRTWYQRDKAAAISAKPQAKELLHWIIDEVISHRKARAFLLKAGKKHELIEALFDARVLHLLKRSISGHDQPGVRYDVYKIDYGCYVDLLTTAKAPQGLLPLDDLGGGHTFVEVPPDDYRAIRRAILNLEDFEAARNSAQDHGEVEQTDGP